MERSKVLIIDAVINFTLGILLLGYSPGIADFLGVPLVDHTFYPNILGGVLFGIGVALLVEYFRGPRGIIGLGLGGAIAINLCGGIVLALWLLAGDLVIPTRGWIFLWALTVVLVGISGVELLVHLKKKTGGGDPSHY